MPQIKDALQHGYEILKFLPHYQLEVNILLAYAINVSRSYLHAHSDDLLIEKDWLMFQEFCYRRQKGEPIAYIVGHKEFWSLEFVVNQHTLIPRPETELLVETCLEILPRKPTLNILDLGTGCGAIAIAIASERQHWQIYASDISAEAIKVSKYNAQVHGIKNITFLQSDWFLNLPEIRFDAIVSNPPYIAANDTHLSALNYEPITALVSGEDGLDDIRKISTNASAFLNHQGWLLLEHGYNQAEDVTSLLKKAGFCNVESRADFAGIKRITLAQWIK